MRSSEKKSALNRAQIGIVLAAFALTSVSMAKMMIISGFSDFSQEFSSIPLVTKQLLISIASLSGIPVTLLMGKAVLYVSKKTLALIAAALFTVGGMLPVFTGNFALMFAARCVMGFGMAMCSTLSTTVIVEYFSGDVKSRLVGYNSAVKSLFGIIFSYLGGVLALISWRSAYYLHLIGVVVFLAVLFCLPQDQREESSRESDAPAAKLHITFPVWYFSFAAVVMFIFFSAHGNNLSLLFAENGIGTSAQAGTASAVFTLGGFLAGLLFFRVYKKIGKYTQIIGYLLAGIGIFAIGLSASYPLICVVSFIFGVAFYLIIPHQTLLVTSAVPRESYTIAYAVYLSAINLGQVISPVILNQLSVWFFGGSVNGRYLVAGIGLGIMALIGWIREILAGKGKLNVFTI